MESHPEQVVDLNDQRLLSLAEKVEREEGRGELEVSYFTLMHKLFCLGYAGR